MTPRQRMRAALICDIAASRLAEERRKGEDDYAEIAEALGYDAIDACFAADAWLIAQSAVGVGIEADLEAAALLRSGWEWGDEVELLHTGASVADCAVCQIKKRPC